MKNKKKNNDFMKKNSKKIIVIALILLLLIGGTYAWLRLTITGKKTNTIIAGILAMELDDSATNGIELLNAVPTTDDVGKTGDAYTFVMENTGNIVSNYTVSLQSQPLNILGDDTLKNMPQNRIKYNLKKTIKQKNGENRDSENDTVISTDSEGITNILNPQYSSETEENNQDSIIDSGSLEPKYYIEYTLVLWIDQDATYEEMKDTAYIGKIKLDAQQ